MIEIIQRERQHMNPGMQPVEFCNEIIQLEVLRQGRAAAKMNTDPFLDRFHHHTAHTVYLNNQSFLYKDIQPSADGFVAELKLLG
ncbi:hypothetical protein D3C75_610940 [compost metagenome]